MLLLLWLWWGRCRRLGSSNSDTLYYPLCPGTSAIRGLCSFVRSRKPPKRLFWTREGMDGASQGSRYRSRTFILTVAASSCFQPLLSSCPFQEHKRGWSSWLSWDLCWVRICPENMKVLGWRSELVTLLNVGTQIYVPQKASKRNLVQLK